MFPGRVAIRRRVLVNLKTSKALAGVLWHSGRAGLVLKDAEIIEQGARPVPMVGDVVIDRSNVDFVQVLPPAPAVLAVTAGGEG